MRPFYADAVLKSRTAKLHGVDLPAPTIGKGESKETVETLDEYIMQLALALTVVVNLLDPSVIVLGGGLSNIDRIYEELPTLIEAYAFSSDGKTQVKKAMYGDSSGRRGAAWLFPAEA